MKYRLPSLVSGGLLALGLSQASAADLTITELNAINLHGPEDKDGDHSAWIEIRNETAEDKDLEGWYLTNEADELTKWAIPRRKVPANGYAIVYVSGKDFGSLFNPEVHASFKLNLETEYLALVEPDGVTIASAYEDLPNARSGFSYGLDENGEPTFFSKVTPAAPNEEPITGFVGDTKFSVDRGFFDAPFQVEITTDTPDAIIYYSTSGRDPQKGSIFSGPIDAIYEGPITIDKTTVLRAAAYKEGLGQSNIDTQTYIFTEDVIAQGNMSTNITESEEYGPLMDEALKAIPTISITIDDDEHLLKRGQGQSRFEGTTVNDYESEISVEWLNADGSEGFQVNAGVSRFGGYYTDHGKYSYRFQFRKKYGTATLNYPIYRGHENGVAPTEEFDSLNLRSGSHDMQARGAYMSNRFVDDTMLEMGGIAPHGRFVHVYINGMYNGQYHLRERWNAAMHASYFGGSEEDYDAINRNDNFTNDPKAFDGDQNYWKEVEGLAREDTPWELLQGHVDLKDYYEFMMVWSAGNSESEMQAVGSKPLNVPFTFYMKDADGWLVRNKFSGSQGRWRGAGPGRFNTELRSENHIDHEMFLADLIHKHYTNGGAMTAEKMVARLQHRVDEIEVAYIAESARWKKHSPAAWLKFQEDAMDRHLTNIGEDMLRMFKSTGAYPDDIQAPSFNQVGGAIESGFNLKMSAGTLFNPEKGEFLYTLDGTDPRLPGGDQAPGVLNYDRQGTGIALDGTVTVKARTWRSSLFSNGKWSPLMEATFHVGERPEPGDLVISEIHYRPAKPSEDEVTAGFSSRSAFEFVEIYNASDSMLSLTEVALTDGVRFDFAGSDITELAPGGLVLVVGNREAFQHRYGAGLPVAGDFDGFKLSDGGEALRLSLPDGVVLQELRYNDKNPWPEDADGDGPSLTLQDPGKMMGDDPAQWTASVRIGGTPGTLGDDDVNTDQVDNDGDGLTALVEEALGTSDADPASGPGNVVVEKRETDGNTYWVVEATRDPAKDDLLIALELSTDLQTWEAADPTFENIDVPASPKKRMWQSVKTAPAMGDAQLYLRLRVSRQ